MKIKELPIVYNDKYGFVVDKDSKIKDNDYFYSLETNKIYSQKEYQNTVYCYKILSYIKLSLESPNIEGLIEVKLVDSSIERILCDVCKGTYGKEFDAWIEAEEYHKHKSNNPFPQPTWEDVEKAIALSNIHFDENGYTTIPLTKKEIIQQLKQSKLPKSFILGEGKTIQEQIKNGRLN